MTSTTQYDAHFLAIGRMLVLFQSLEATLKDGLVLLLNNQLGTPSGQLAYAAISDLSFGAAMRLASTLPGVFTAERIGAKDEDGKKRLSKELADAAVRLKEGVKLAGEVEQRRNQLVHSRWFISPGYAPEPGKMTRTKTSTKSGTLKSVMQSESLDDVNANTEKARKAQSLIGSALQDYGHISRYVW